MFALPAAIAAAVACSLAFVAPPVDEGRRRAASRRHACARRPSRATDDAEGRRGDGDAAGGQAALSGGATTDTARGGVEFEYRIGPARTTLLPEHGVWGLGLAKRERGSMSVSNSEHGAVVASRDGAPD